MENQEMTSVSPASVDISEQSIVTLDVAGEMQRIRTEVRHRLRADSQVQATDVTPPLEWRELRRLLREASERWRVKELPFESSLPLIGRLLVTFRTAWNSVACKWHVRRILLQQNDYNLTVFQLLQDMFEVSERLERSNRVLSDQVNALETRLRVLESVPSDGKGPGSAP
jgi:hypothetical protein